MFALDSLRHSLHTPPPRQTRPRGARVVATPCVKDHPMYTASFPRYLTVMTCVHLQSCLAHSWRIARTMAVLAIVVAAPLLAPPAYADCESDYDRCTRTCDDVNDCPGGCLGCTLGCLIAKVICDSDSFAGSDSFAAFDPVGGTPGDGPLQTFIPGKPVILRAGLYRAGDPGFTYDGSTPFIDSDRAGVTEVGADYRGRSAKDGRVPPWLPLGSISEPRIDAGDHAWQAELLIHEADVDPRGYDVRFHFLMADGSARTANTAIIPQCVDCPGQTGRCE
jgi:hypothetical protein